MSSFRLGLQASAPQMADPGDITVPPMTTESMTVAPAPILTGPSRALWPRKMTSGPTVARSLTYVLPSPAWIRRPPSFLVASRPRRAARLASRSAAGVPTSLQ